MDDISPDIDTAWKQADDRLPEGWRLISIKKDSRYRDGEYRDTFWAFALGPHMPETTCNRCGSKQKAEISHLFGYGTTPIDSIRDLLTHVIELKGTYDDLPSQQPHS